MSRHDTGTDGGPATRRNAPPCERRLWERYPARGSGATLSWLEGATERTIRADLRDISGEGACFVAEVLPPSGVPLWLRPEAGERRGGRIDPVECRLVTTADDPSGVMVTRIRFVGQCPIDLFDLAVNRVE